MWTLLMDMHSGGGVKEPPFDEIYIETSEDEAKSVFYSRFGHSPDRVSCTCCGPDYSLSSAEDFEQASAFHRGCGSSYFYEDDGTEVTADVSELVYDRRLESWVHGERPVVFKYVERPDYQMMEYGISKRRCKEKYVAVEGYKTQENVLIICADDIADQEREVIVPQQGFVWVE